MCEEKWGGVGEARSALKHKGFFPLTFWKHAELVSTLLLRSGDQRNVSVAWFLHHFSLQVCCPTGCSVVLAKACRTGVAVSSWSGEVLSDVTCLTSDASSVCQSGLKNSTQLQRATKDQREHEMKLHVSLLLCFTLCSWLLLCYSPVWHLSMPAALILHDNNPQLLQLMLWCHLYLFSGWELRGITFPQVCAWWLWAGVLCCGWRVPAPSICFFASLSLLPCRWANTCFVECERKVAPRLQGSCFGFNWHDGEWCQFLWRCVKHPQLHVSLLSGCYAHTQCCFNSGFVFS